MTKEEAIKYLQQLYHNCGHCWLDEQRIEAIGMAVKALQEEPDYCCGECVKWVDGKGCSREKQNTHCITDAACEEGVRRGSKQKKPKFKVGATIKCKYDDEKFELVEEPVSEGLEESVKAVTKDKESAVKFLKNAGIMDENGNLAELYRSEEPVSEVWHDANEEQPEGCRTVVVWNPTTMDGEVLTRCVEVYKGGIWAYIDDILNLSNVERTTKNWKEPVSEELEEAAKKYMRAENPPIWGLYYGFKAGAQWQKQQDKETIELAEDHAMLAGMEKMKQQMIEKAVPADVMFDYYDDKDRLNVSILATDVLADEHSIKENDKVKIIIIK